MEDNKQPAQEVNWSTDQINSERDATYQSYYCNDLYCSAFVVTCRNILSANDSTSQESTSICLDTLLQPLQSVPSLV